MVPCPDWEQWQPSCRIQRRKLSLEGPAERAPGICVLTSHFSHSVGKGATDEVPTVCQPPRAELGDKRRKEDLSAGAKDDISAKPKGDRDRHHAAQMAQGRLIDTVKAKVVGLGSLRKVTIGCSEPNCDPAVQGTGVG